MKFFSRPSKTSGYLAIHSDEEGICAAHIDGVGSAKPVLDVFVFAPAEQLAVNERLSRLGKELHVSRYRCSTLLAAGEYQLLTVEAPNVAADELKQAIRWRLKDMLDFHVDDATIDVLDIPVDKNAPSRNHSMLAIAARNQLIEQRQALFGDAKIRLSVIDIPEMAQRNLSALLEPAGRGIALLSFHAGGGLLTVTFNGELYLARRIDVPLAQLLQTDAAELAVCYDRITLELQRSLDHFDRQFHFITLAKLVLAPLGAAGAGLRDYLAANMYLPIDTFDLGHLIDLSSVPALASAQVQQRHLLTIGAALRSEGSVL